MKRICSNCHAELPLDTSSRSVRNASRMSALSSEPNLCPGVPPMRRPAEPEALRSLFPQLEIDGLLGTGGMGAVYRARQRGLDRPVALKILAPKFSGDPAFGSDLPVKRARWRG